MTRAPDAAYNCRHERSPTPSRPLHESNGRPKLGTGALVSAAGKPGDRARQEVLTYLDWVVHDVASTGDPDSIRCEINRAAARLIEIALHWRPAIDAEFEHQRARERLEREREWFQQQRQLSSPDSNGTARP